MSDELEERFALENRIADIDEDIWYKRQELSELEFLRRDLAAEYLRKYDDRL